MVDDGADYLIHVVGLVGAVGNDFVESVFQTVDGVGAFNQRRLLKVVLRNEAEELACDFQCVLAIFGCEVAYTAFGRVYLSAAEGFLGHILACHGLYYLRACEEHIGDTLGHDGEVGEGGGVYGTAGAGTENT